MKYIDSRTVEFTTMAEVWAHNDFNDALDRGLNIPDAARVALEKGLATNGRWTRDFVEYLSEGTLWVTNARTIILTVKGKAVTRPTPAT